MRMRRRRLLLLAALLGGAAAALPAIALSEPPSISAYNEPGIYGGHSWMPATATVSAGGVVKFANPYSTTYHGLKFTGGSAGATPSCTGIPAAAGEVTGAVSWQGECTFSAPGTYTFICTVHPTEMTGTITVNPNGTTTTTTTTTAPTSTAPTTMPSAPGEPSPGVSLARGLSLRSSQRGGSVKGTLDIAKAQAGGRLEIEIRAKRGSLASAGHAARVRVGRLVRGSVSAGRLSFAVKLNARARSALRRHRRLALTVKITLTPVHAHSLTVSRSIVEHA
jgi:plastocyanin